MDGKSIVRLYVSSSTQGMQALEGTTGEGRVYPSLVQEAIPLPGPWEPGDKVLLGSALCDKGDIWGLAGLWGAQDLWVLCLEGGGSP